MDKEEWAQAADDRREIFRPTWFKQLLGGQLSLGDTFWIGNFGVALIFVPLAFVFSLILLIFTGINDQVTSFRNIVILILMALYYAFLTRAVLISAVRTPQVGAWRWIGLGYTALKVITMSALAFVMLISV